MTTTLGPSFDEPRATIPPKPEMGRKTFERLLDRLSEDIVGGSFDLKSPTRGADEAHNLRVTLADALGDFVHVPPPMPKLKLTASAWQELVAVVAQTLVFPEGDLEEPPKATAVRTAAEILQARFEVEVV